MVVNLAGPEAAAKSLKGSSLKLLYYGTVLLFLVSLVSPVSPVSLFFFILLFCFCSLFMKIYIPRESAGVRTSELYLISFTYTRWSLNAKLTGTINFSVSFSVSKSAH
jgi:hypothetical protein